MKRSLRRIITHSLHDVLIKTQRVNLSLLVLACLISPTVTITELAKSFLCLPDSPHKSSMRILIPHSARITFNSNPSSFLERKIFIHYTIPAECSIIELQNCIKCFILTFTGFHNKVVPLLGGNKNILQRGLILIE